MITKNATTFLTKAKDKKFCETVRTDDTYKPFVDDLKEMYKKYAIGEIVFFKSLQYNMGNMQ